uniref:Uncharacterized protein n=1 Tax=Timema tahoe TaxID=61484 RepID=A0A7R9P040_9NEOP|nr:unnamed protein product [Timema tahoe]
MKFSMGASTNVTQFYRKSYNNTLSMKVGYRSNLKTSQSISDLSRIPEKDFRNHHGVNLAHRYTPSGEDYEPSDDCIADLEEDCFPVLGGSSSSTPATSSSAANSPKRLWPPASRAPVQRHLPKRMSSSCQPVLPNKKCSSVVGSDDCVEGSSGSLRRACSLSDLANPTPRRILHDTLAQGPEMVDSCSLEGPGTTLGRYAPVLLNALDLWTVRSCSLEGPGMLLGTTGFRGFTAMSLSCWEYRGVVYEGKLSLWGPGVGDVVLEGVSERQGSLNFINVPSIVT